MRTALLLAGISLAFLAGWWGHAWWEPPVSASPTALPASEGVPPRLEGLRRADALDRDAPSTVEAVSKSASPEHRRVGNGTEGSEIADGQPDLDVSATALAAARALVKRVDALLSGGSKTHLDLWRLLESLASDEDIEWYYAETAETAAARHAWTRFLMEREDDVAVFLEAAYQRMGETQIDPDDVSLDGLGVIAPNYGAHLVALLTPTRLDALRKTLRQLVLEPDLLAKEGRSSARGYLNGVLAGWAMSASPAEARRVLQSGEATGAEALALLERIPSSEVAQHDPGVILCRFLRESGDWSAFIRNLWWVPNAAGAFSAASLQQLDAAVFVFTRSSVYTDHPLRLQRFLRATGRGGWPEAEAFVDAGLEVGGHARTHVPLLLGHLRPRPPPHVVRRVLSRETLPTQVRVALEALLTG